MEMLRQWCATCEDWAYGPKYCPFDGAILTPEKPSPYCRHCIYEPPKNFDTARDRFCRSCGAPRTKTTLEAA